MPTSIITTSIVALLTAIRAVESCDGLDRRANGNDYQVTSVCLADVNRLYGTRYRWPQDVRDSETAEDIIILYLGYYGVRYFDDYHKIPSQEVLAKIYNCGYAGFKRGDRRGEDYWRRIQAQRKRENRRAKK